MTTIIGLDISQTCTGMARLVPAGQDVNNPDPTKPRVTWSHVPCPKGKGFYDDQERAARTLRAVADWADAESGALTQRAVVIEDFAFGVQMAGTRSIAMVTGLIRYWLWKQRIPFVLVSPQSLKKFIVGRASKKGDKIGKEIVNRELYARFGHSVDNNDAADAVGLAYIGAALTSIWTPQTEAQREVLKKLKIEERK